MYVKFVSDEYIEVHGITGAGGPPVICHSIEAAEENLKRAGYSLQDVKDSLTPQEVAANPFVAKPAVPADAPQNLDVLNKALVGKETAVPGRENPYL